MSTDSRFRRAVKQVISPLVSQRFYQRIQAAAMAWDIKTGAWYEPEVDLIAAAIRKGETALDIGANFGFYSYYLSCAVGPSGRVYAFEPIPWTAGVFSMVAAVLRLQNVELLEKGCGNQPGTLKFRAPLQRNGGISAGLACFADRDEAGREAGELWQLGYREFTCEVIRSTIESPILKVFRSSSAMSRALRVWFLRA